MWSIPFYIVIAGLIIYLTAATLYLMVLAVAYFVVKEPETAKSTKLKRFAILIPAHNEELLISHLCESLLKINYPKECYEIFIIADNCDDRTAEICKAYSVNVLTRNDPSRIGKGYALNSALERIRLEKFDAVLVVDADNIVDPFILEELNPMINQGERAIQCNNSVGNRSDSWFTQLLFVSRTVGNLLYHHSKYKLGLSSYLMGNGICFSTELLLKKGWTAFTVGEDWEYYAQLIRERIKIGFAVKAKVYHQESRSLEQATTQRLRWSSGRFSVLRKLGFKLFLKGLLKRDWFTLDASLPLIFPNYSLQFNLTILTLIMLLLLPASALKTYLIVLSLGLICSQMILFFAGMFLARCYWEVLKAILRAPLFLIWKAFIDFLSLTRMYRGDKWIRTERHISQRKIDTV
jgi:cellulose synthase/poly-beta-1,6-N-acetylglucosamine synthase-like glycosyltransferase